MEDKLFDTKEKIDAAVAAFKSLMAHEGWLLFTSILNANIDVVRKQLETGSDNETVDDIKIKRMKLKLYRELLDTPKDMVYKFTNPDFVEVNPDPYEK